MEEFKLPKRRGITVVKKKYTAQRDGYIMALVKNLTNELEENKSSFDFVNWLSSYFKTMESSNTAAVLLGNQKISEGIIWEKVIQPIFGFSYTILLNDEILNLSIDKIVKEKVFYLIGNITENESNKKKINQLFQAILIDKYLITNNKTDLNKIPVFGQILITSKLAISMLNEFHTQFEYVFIQDEDNITNNLKVKNIVDLQLKLTDKELDIFSNKLYRYCSGGGVSMSSLFKTEENVERKDYTPKFNQDEEIDTFIDAIKKKDLEYFDKVKNIENGLIIYEHLTNAFKDGYFIGRDLLYYYNATHEVKFENKKQLTDKLKEKDEMFKQEVKTLKILTVEQKEEILFQAHKTSKEIGNKELYKINCYTIAKDITIPYGAVITSSQDNIRKYNLINSEEAIKLHKKYHEKNKKDSQN